MSSMQLLIDNLDIEDLDSLPKVIKGDLRLENNANNFITSRFSDSVNDSYYESEMEYFMEENPDADPNEFEFYGDDIDWDMEVKEYIQSNANCSIGGKVYY